MTTTIYASTWRQEQWKGPKRYIAIVVYDTLEDFRSACRKKDQEPDDPEWNDAVAAFFPAAKWTKTGWVIPEHKHFAGTMRFVKDWITDENIIHETVHAASHIYRLDVDKFIRLGTSCDDREEHLAYIIGDLGASVTSSLWEADLFNENFLIKGS